MARNSAESAVKRISGEFHGDDAVEMEIIEVSLGVSRIARSKSDRDDLVLRAARFALTKTLALYRLETGERFPEYHDFLSWLTNGEYQRESETMYPTIPPALVMKKGEGGGDEGQESSGATEQVG